MLITMLTSSLALFVASLGFLAYDLIAFRGLMSHDLMTQAEVIAANSAAAVAFRDEASAKETLSALRARREIVTAALFTSDRQLLARYDRENAAPNSLPDRLEASGYHFEKNYLKAFHGIVLRGQRLGTLYIESDMQQWYARLRRYAAIVGILTLGSAFFAFLLSSRLQSVISEPILGLEKTIRMVSAEKNFSLRAVKSNHDEIGILIDGFNAMLSEIQQRDTDLDAAHKQVVESSRQAGMAEVATAVLHNVGNVLTSVNVSASFVTDAIRKSKLPGLAKAVALMSEQSSNLGHFLTVDPKGKRLPYYLEELAEHLSNEQVVMLKELSSLSKNIEHIKDIVAMQQSYARVSGVVESISAVELVDDALRMNAEALTRHGVQIIREFGEIPKVSVDKHKVLQILVNLVSNAKYALDEGNPPVKQLALRIGMNENSHFKIAVVDNGVGIPKENLARIFAHGFTTKKRGHGFGLHSGALAAKEMGGTLRVHSEGPGKGAIFTLELPLMPGKPFNG